MVWGRLGRSEDVWRRSGSFGELCGLLFDMWVHLREVFGRWGWFEDGYTTLRERLGTFLGGSGTLWDILGLLGRYRTPRGGLGTLGEVLKVYKAV